MAYLRSCDQQGAEVPIVVLPDGTPLVDPQPGELAQHGTRHAHGRRPQRAVRCGHHRRWSRWSRRGRLRVVGRARRSRHRARVDRGSGGNEHADPELPRLLARIERRGTRTTRVPAGMGVRGDVPAHSRRRGRCVPAGAGFVVSISGGAEVEARSVILAMGVSYRRLDVPALDRARGTRRPLRLVAVGRAAVQWRQRLRRRWRELGRAGRGSPRALRGRVTLVCRRSLSSTMSQYLLDEIEGKANIHVREGAGGRRRGRDGAPRERDAPRA